MADRDARAARVGSIRAPLLLILLGALDFLLAPASVRALPAGVLHSPVAGYLPPCEALPYAMAR